MEDTNMSLSDFASPPRHAAPDEPGPVATFMHWFSGVRADAVRPAAPVDHRNEIHAAREKGYLHDIGI